MEFPSIKLLLIVGIGSFIGGVLRYAISFLMQGRTDGTFPWGTFSVNIIGCLLIGLLYFFVEKQSINYGMRLFVIIGILGGFTTFSSFSLESVSLLKNGFYSTGIIYVFGSLIFGLGATMLGYGILKYFN